MSKRDFIKHLKSSNFFLKSFDKNKDGVLTEVGIGLPNLKLNPILVPNQIT